MKKKTICPLDCPDACGVIATLSDGKITQLDGDPDHSITNGFLCSKFRNYHQRIYHPERLSTPLLRTGRKGEGKFEKISWDHALNLITAKLKEIEQDFGSEAVLPYYYAGNMGVIARSSGEGFFNRYGSSHLLGTICSAAAKAGWTAHCGDLPGPDYTVTEEADLIIAWGINAKVTSSHWIPFVNKARKKGAKLIVIDPYNTTTAKSADIHFQVKPGGDSALALGLLKILHQENQLDTSFIEQHTDGFSELESYIQATNINNFIESSGISLEEMKQLAQFIQENPKTFIRVGLGITRNTRGAMSVRAIACLAAGLGLFQGKPGAAILLTSGAFHTDSETVSRPSLGKPGRRSINMVQLGEALNKQTDPIKMLFVYSSNPLTIAPDSNSVLKGFQREDLFTVVHEHFLTPTARYADLVLPATTSFENHDFYTSYGQSYAGVIEPVIKPYGEAKSNFELFKLLSEKMGYTEESLNQTIEKRIEELVSTTKGVPQDFKDNIQPGKWFQSTLMDNAGNFTRSNSRFQFSISTDEPGVPFIPCIAEAREIDNPDLISRYPYLMSTPPVKSMLNSTFGEQHQYDNGTLLVHPEDAARENLKSEDRVKIFNHRGEHHRKIKITEDTQPGMLIAEGVYWHSINAQNLSVNTLTSQTTTDMGGGGTFHEIRVNLEKIT